MRYLSICVVAVFVLVACKNQSTQKHVVHEQLVLQYFEYFNHHDWEKMANMYADTAYFKDPSLGVGIVKQSRKQTLEKYTELHKVFPDLHDQIIQTYPAGDNHFVVEFISTGTGPDHMKFELPICTIFTFKDGRIIKDFTYYDNFENPNSVK